MRVLSWGMIAAVVCWLGVLREVAFAEVPVSFPPATPEIQGVPAATVRQLSDEVAGYVKAGTIVKTRTEKRHFSPEIQRSDLLNFRTAARLTSTVHE
jgi:hypothetical protein